MTFTRRCPTCPLNTVPRTRVHREKYLPHVCSFPSFLSFTITPLPSLLPNDKLHTPKRIYKQRKSPSLLLSQMEDSPSWLFLFLSKLLCPFFPNWSPVPWVLRPLSTWLTFVLSLWTGDSVFLYHPFLPPIVQTRSVLRLYKSELLVFDESLHPPYQKEVLFTPPLYYPSPNSVSNLTDDSLVLFLTGPPTGPPGLREDCQLKPCSPGPHRGYPLIPCPLLPQGPPGPDVPLRQVSSNMSILS